MIGSIRKCLAGLFDVLDQPKVHAWLERAVVSAADDPSSPHTTSAKLGAESLALFEVNRPRIPSWRLPSDQARA